MGDSSNPMPPIDFDRIVAVHRGYLGLRGDKVPANVREALEGWVCGHVTQYGGSLVQIRINELRGYEYDGRHRRGSAFTVYARRIDEGEMLIMLVETVKDERRGEMLSAYVTIAKIPSTT